MFPGFKPHLFWGLTVNFSLSRCAQCLSSGPVVDSSI